MVCSGVCGACVKLPPQTTEGAGTGGPMRAERKSEAETPVPERQDSLKFPLHPYTIRPLSTEIGPFRDAFVPLKGRLAAPIPFEEKFTERLAAPRNP